MDDDRDINIDPAKRRPKPDEPKSPPEEPQFISDTSGKPKLEDKKFPAWRSFAKFYFSDFDQDKHHDIIVWRKRFVSRLNKDPIKGFNKEGELWLHYSLIAGEYQKQKTSPAIIKKWLGDKQLTWKKGYPSKSECKGEEGKLIPEIHDPLLNDPEVLR